MSERDGKVLLHVISNLVAAYLGRPNVSAMGGGLV